MVPPLVLDVDGTLTTPAGRLDRRVFKVLPEWDAPVVIATGKAFPYPVALCHFLGLPERVVAENGGVVHVDGETTVPGHPEAARAAVAEYRARGGADGWGPESTVNRWRETEVALPPDADEALLREVCADYPVAVVDTGYAFHVTSPDVDKGRGLEAVCEALADDPSAFVAVGENDVPTFGVVRESHAVANADAAARAAADAVRSEGYMDGTLAVLEELLAER